MCVSIVPPLKEYGRAPFPASDLGQVFKCSFPRDSGLRMQVIGLLRHTCTSQFSVLSHVFGFISGENLDKIQFLEKTKIMVGGLRGGREQKKGKMGSFL